jgi:hypothetical protein
MKDDYLKIIEFVINKRPEIIELKEIYAEVNNFQTIGYSAMIQLIKQKESRKLGGYAVPLNAALKFLTQELNIHRKNEKRFNRK